MHKIIQNILDEQNAVYAIFDKEAQVLESSRGFGAFLKKSRISRNNTLWDLFPELVGSEDQITLLQEGSLKKLGFDKLSRAEEDYSLSFYNLAFFPYQPAKGHIICIITDTSPQSLLEQKLQQQENEIKLLRSSLAHLGQGSTVHLIGSSPQITKVREFIKKIADIKNTIILLSGESGTGKNLVARNIHYTSCIADKPFVEINCAAIPETLLESEIFGYEKGAFTNAVNSKKGLLEEADGGTLFLDEISELPLSLQAKFLTFIETKTFRRLGSNAMRRVKTRIIVASNRDLKEAVEQNQFRKDLFFRINVLNIKLPALREIGSDTISIAEDFVATYAFDFGKKVTGLTQEAKQRLMRYSWPGNVRELRNIIERAVIFAEGPLIDLKDIFITDEQEVQNNESLFSFPLPETGVSIYDIEKELIAKALVQVKNNQTKAAQLLGLSLDTLRYRMKKYDIA